MLGVERNLTGTYNATGPAKKLTMKAMLDGIKKGDRRRREVHLGLDRSFSRQERSPRGATSRFGSLANGEEGFAQTQLRQGDRRRARRSGPSRRRRRTRSPGTRRFPHDRRGKLLAGISADKERELLAAWHAKVGKNVELMDWGLSNRLARILKPPHGRTVMLAVDHGYFLGPTSGLEEPRKTIAPLLAVRRLARC